MKLFLFVLVCLFAFFVSVAPVEASLVTVSDQGDIEVNVLGDFADRDVSVVRVSVSAGDTKDDKISFARIDGNVSLKVSTPTGEQTMEVTDFGEDLIEIESRGDVERVIIGVQGDKYVVTQGDLRVLTDYDISIDPQNSRLSFTTPQGVRFVSVFPKDATNLLLRSKVMSGLSSDTTMQIIEDEDGFLSYQVVGYKDINLLNIMDLPVEITGYVSTSTGEIIEVDQPIWLPIVDYLFS